MQIPRERQAIRQATERLVEILDAPEAIQSASYEVPGGNGRMVDAVLTVRGHCFILEWKRSGSASVVAGAIHQLRALRDSFPREAILLLAVPYMGDVARDLCARADVAWLDLSGNARIVVPGVFYQNLGNPNLFRRPGRPRSAFGPSGSRVARHLLMMPSRTFKQSDIAAGASLSKGHVSRIVRRLAEAGLLERAKDGVRVTDRGALLDAWRDDYRFDRQHVIRGHIPARTGESLTRSVAEALERIGMRYAATALPAAWLWTQHAGFRLSTIYLSHPPSLAAIRDLGFREEARGSNLWLVVPGDEGVFEGAEEVDGIRCVHPLQAYLDLKGHPERAAEAAAELRVRLLSGGKDDH